MASAWRAAFHVLLLSAALAPQAGWARPPVMVDDPPQTGLWSEDRVSSKPGDSRHQRICFGPRTLGLIKYPFDHPVGRNCSRVLGGGDGRGWIEIRCEIAPEGRIVFTTFDRLDWTSASMVRTNDTMDVGGATRFNSHVVTTMRYLGPCPPGAVEDMPVDQDAAPPTK